MAKHISGFYDKSAQNLSGTHCMLNDIYHNNIQTAAIYLSESGRGNFQYVSQYKSGNSIWENSNSKNRAIVYLDSI